MTRSMLLAWMMVAAPLAPAGKQTGSTSGTDKLEGQLDLVGDRPRRDTGGG